MTATDVRATADVIQLVFNFAAVVGGAAVWKFYVENLKAAKSVVEERRDFWKEKAQALENRTPEAVERILAERIATRETELVRLAEDTERNAESLRLVNQEKALLEQTLDTTKGFRKMLAMDSIVGGDDDYDFAAHVARDLEVVKIGEVLVDSGQLLITDPAYLDRLWKEEPYVGQSPSPVGGFRYSYGGACDATLSVGYGELLAEQGHVTAGVVFSTAFGDGIYPIYGEKHEGRMMRIYVNVA